MLLKMVSFFFFNDTATTEIYTLSLHDALPIFVKVAAPFVPFMSEEIYQNLVVNLDKEAVESVHLCTWPQYNLDRKSTRLNSSHANISYAVFCLKKKKYNSDSYTQSDINAPIFH